MEEFEKTKEQPDEQKPENVKEIASEHPGDKEEELLEKAQRLEMEIEEEHSSKRLAFMSGMLTGVVIATLISVGAMLVNSGLLSGGNSSVTGAAGTAGLGNASSDADSLSELVDDELERKATTIAATLYAGYYKEIDTDTLRDGMLKGMVTSLGDKYSAYYTAEEYKKLQESTYAYITGIGVVLTTMDDNSGFKVLKVYEDTPAEKGGILEGDVITEVDGYSASDVSMNELVTNLRGEEGSIAHLKVKRFTKDGATNLTFDIERARIDVPTIYHEMADPENAIGYIEIAEFGGKTDEEFIEAYDELLAEGAKSFVIDLRNNPGGVVNTATKVADRILPEGLIVYTEDRFGNRQEIFSDEVCIDAPMVVLVNSNTASSAEILSGALHDYGYATIIGEKTYGKGIVQSIAGLYDGSAVKYTHSTYYTPKGTNINGIGITPDIEVEFDYSGPLDESYEYKYDSQMAKAMEILMLGLPAEGKR